MEARHFRDGAIDMSRTSSAAHDLVVNHLLQRHPVCQQHLVVVDDSVIAAVRDRLPRHVRIA